MPVGWIARITTRSNVIIPPHSEVLANGILQGKMDTPVEEIIQLHGRFLEKYHVGVASVLGRRQGNNVPLQLINMQEEPVRLPTWACTVQQWLYRKEKCVRVMVIQEEKLSLKKYLEVNYGTQQSKINMSFRY